MSDIETRLLKIEDMAMECGVSWSIPGTTLTRVLLDKGFGWSLGVGGLEQPKKFFVALTIDQALLDADAWLTERLKSDG